MISRLDSDPDQQDRLTLAVNDLRAQLQSMDLTSIHKEEMDYDSNREKKATTELKIMTERFGKSLSPPPSNGKGNQLEKAPKGNLFENSLQNKIGK